MNRNSSMDNHSGGDIINGFTYKSMHADVGAFSPAYSHSATPSTPHYEIFAPNTFSAMKYRNLGKNGLKLPNVGLAVWSAFGTRVGEQVAEELVTIAYENGCNYFDTGDAFAGGKSELVLGNILRKKTWRRSSYIVATKLFCHSGPSAHNGGGLSRKFIIEAVEASLKRLQLKYIDLILINKFDGMCPMEEIVRATQYLLDNGMIMYWYTRDKMELFMPELFHKMGTGCIAWSPSSLANDDGIHLITRRVAALHEEKLTKFKELAMIATKLSCDVTQLTIDKNCGNIS